MKSKYVLGIDPARPNCDVTTFFIRHSDGTIEDISGFNPDWYSPPSDTIRDILVENNNSKEQWATDMGVSIKYVMELLDDKIPIDLDVATKLSETLGSSPRFWLNRYTQYLEMYENYKKLKKDL